MGIGPLHSITGATYPWPGLVWRYHPAGIPCFLQPAKNTFRVFAGQRTLAVFGVATPSSETSSRKRPYYSVVVTRIVQGWYDGIIWLLTHASVLDRLGWDATSSGGTVTTCLVEKPVPIELDYTATSRQGRVKGQEAVRRAAAPYALGAAGGCRPP